MLLHNPILALVNTSFLPSLQCWYQIQDSHLLDKWSTTELHLLFQSFTLFRLKSISCIMSSAAFTGMLEDREIKTRVRKQKAEVKWSPFSKWEKGKCSANTMCLFKHSAGWCHVTGLNLATCLFGLSWAFQVLRAEIACSHGSPLVIHVCDPS